MGEWFEGSEAITSMVGSALRVDAALQDILLDGREISRESLREVLGLKPCLGLEIEMKPNLADYDLHIPGMVPSPPVTLEAGS